MQRQAYKAVITQEINSVQAPASDLPAEQSFWLCPPENLSLGLNEAHIWLVRLNEINAIELEQIISDSERSRAARFHFELHKKIFIGSRGILRIILGKYLQINPRRLQFEYGEFGKPYLAGEYGSKIKFNLSHSNDLAIFAVTRRREVGVDIEHINHSFVDERMVSQCLAPLETAHFQSLPKEKRNVFFFESWTRKEAFLKACGSGLAVAPNQLETLSFTDFSKSFAGDNSEYRMSDWSLQTIPLINGYAAALAVEGNSPRLRFWHQREW